jgi:hypothetical protein
MNPPPPTHHSETRGRTPERLSDLHARSCIKVEVIDLDSSDDESDGADGAAGTRRSGVEADVIMDSPDDDEPDSQSDTGPEKMWDPHSGLKPSEKDGDGSDGEVEVEDDLPHHAAIEVNDAMIDMTAELEDDRDLDWLPPEERKRVVEKQES